VHLPLTVFSGCDTHHQATERQSNKFLFICIKTLDTTKQTFYNAKMDNKRIRPRARRNGFTLPNPFITDNINVVDINNLTDEQKAMPLVRHDFSYIRQPQFEHLFIFAFTEYSRNIVKGDDSTAEKVIAERAFFKDYESAKEFFRIVSQALYTIYETVLLSFVISRKKR